MNRREFSQTLGAAAGAALLRASWPQRGPVVDGDRLISNLTTLAGIGRNANGGSDRVAFSDADVEARAFVQRLMRAAQLDVEIDAAGNILGRRPGRDAGRAPIMLGSHIDSVPNGGHYDGPAGAFGAIEVAQTLAERHLDTRHPLEVVVFSNEEGGKTGSRAISGEVRPDELHLPTASGKTIGEGIALVGGDPTRLHTVARRRGGIAGFLELHIEQGTVLERERIDIGVVQGIVGITRWNVTVEGFANHAGTTPMDQRRDALLAAASIIETVNRIATETPGRHVATVGRIEVSPSAPNVIPGRVVLSLEIRDLDMVKIDQVFERIRDDALETARVADVTVAFEQFYVSHAALTDERFRGVIDRAARRLGHSVLHMPSGAGHDAQSIAQLAPIGMIFVPSVAGISHSPQEFSRPDDVVAGANVLLRGLLDLDALLAG